MSNEEQMRADFEAWWIDFTGVHEDWRFADSDALRWQSWQAATASKQREIDALNQQVLEFSAMVEKMREALRSIATDPGCGCSFPCRCESKEATRIELEARMDIASEALSITQSSTLLAHDNEVAAKALEELLDKFAFFSSEDGLWLADAIQVIANERRNRK